MVSKPSGKNNTNTLTAKLVAGKKITEAGYFL